MKSRRFAAFNIGTDRDAYTYGLQPYAEYPAFGQIENKAFPTIPTSVKLVVVGAIIMAFTASKKVKARANPRGSEFATKKDVRLIMLNRDMDLHALSSTLDAMGELLSFCMGDCIDNLPRSFSKKLVEAGLRIPISQKAQRKHAGLKAQERETRERKQADFGDFIKDLDRQ
jgi:hypothetical protein